ncbi:50S ribosomal protein L4 [bacterium BMS3Bbin06]|nr:50S ribosomal protein L4 [bacterium BMS3Abin08]GBE34385.1 50S ribosomal protein L4 [bacterium BMS3Bbin06]HDO36199.1 50S ribosomal protein L4 [Nitrospirota bacterium]
MPGVEVKDRNNSVVEKIEMPEGIFGLEIKTSLLHAAVVNYLANQRQGTHATKTRGKVRGGSKKPWRQKHTGRARHGTNRSPLWKGGGVIFGPHPRDYSYRMPKKQKRKALKTALSVKFAEGNLVVVDALSFEKPRTKDMIAVLRNFGINDKKVLVVMPDKDENVYLSARNIPRVSVMRAADINTYELLVHEHVLVTKDALEKIREVWG